MITFTAKFQQHPDELVQAILIDMLLIAPLVYYVIIYKTGIAKATVLRVFAAGAILATVILSKTDSPAVVMVKTYIVPVAVILLVSHIFYSFYSLKRRYSKLNYQNPDFLIQARAVLTSILGSATVANIMAAEIAVFYYIFSKKRKTIDNKTRFTCYRENGIRLVLITFLALFLIETAGMHFLFQLWNETAAWILTSLSIYSCLHLFAHIKSLKSRPIVVSGSELHLCNGILGGDVVLQPENIEKIVQTHKQPSEPGVIKLAFIKEFEKHNVAIYLKEPVTVIKAFGIKNSGKILLISIDNPQDFIIAMNMSTEV